MVKRKDKNGVMVLFLLPPVRWSHQLSWVGLLVVLLEAGAGELVREVTVVGEVMTDRRRTG